MTLSYSSKENGNHQLLLLSSMRFIHLFSFLPPITKLEVAVLPQKPRASAELQFPFPPTPTGKCLPRVFSLYYILFSIHLALMSSIFKKKKKESSLWCMISSSNILHSYSPYSHKRLERVRTTRCTEVLTDHFSSVNSI